MTVGTGDCVGYGNDRLAGLSPVIGNAKYRAPGSARSDRQTKAERGARRQEREKICKICVGRADGLASYDDGNATDVCKHGGMSTWSEVLAAHISTTMSSVSLLEIA